MFASLNFIPVMSWRVIRGALTRHIAMVCPFATSATSNDLRPSKIINGLFAATRVGWVARRPNPPARHLAKACLFTASPASDSFSPSKIINHLFAASRPNPPARHHPLSAITVGVQKPECSRNLDSPVGRGHQVGHLAALVGAAEDKVEAPSEAEGMSDWPSSLAVSKENIVMYRSYAASVRCRILVLGLMALCWSMPSANAAGGAPETFASPEQAAAALVSAARRNNQAELLKIFGPAGQDLISSGDKIADKNARARFVDHYNKGNKILLDDAHKATLVIGTDEWPFPIPIVQQSSLWHFDTQAGAQEILNRRIGRNQLSAINVCRSYVQAQSEYAADRESEQKPKEYARKFVSSSGRHDGLYWPVRPGEKESPSGPLMASAQAEGYGSSDDHEKHRHAPYHGYYYKILTHQGAAAPGGARNYVVNGHMTGGFGLIAFPAKYGDSGVLTFIVNQDGIVYEKDLGPDTATAARAMAEFNPDHTWKIFKASALEKSTY